MIIRVKCANEQVDKGQISNREEVTKLTFQALALRQNKERDCGLCVFT